MERAGPHTWGARPSQFLTVRDKVDLHNISQDSGLSHSPVQQEPPQLTIGKPIGHINLLPPPQPQPRKKQKKWKIGGIFRRRSKEIKSSDLPSDSVDQSRHAVSPVSPVPASVPVLPQRNASFRHSQPQPQPHHYQQQQPPPLPPKKSQQQEIFPHLRADLQYPELERPPVSVGYYYDPRFGYVRAGSYYDQQILMMRGEQRLSWRDGKQSRLRAAAEQRRSLLSESSSDSEETEGSGSLGVRRAGSVGSLNRRSRGARTERFLSRRSTDLTTPPPPPPPPRDEKLRHQLLSRLGGRPVSSSFEQLRVPNSLDNLKTPVRQQHSHPLPPVRPHSHRQTDHFTSSDLSQGITRETAVSQPSSLENYVDPQPRSRKPIHYQHHHHQPAGSVGSSEGIGGSETSLEESHYYVGSVSQQVTTLTTPTISPSLPSQAPARYERHNNKHKHLSIQEDRSGSHAKDSPYTIQSETHSHNLEKSGISSPNSISSKDSGCSASYDVQPSIPAPVSKPGASLSSVEETHDRPRAESEVAVKMFASSDDQSTAAGFSTQKRRSRFEEAIKELELVYNNIANDEDLLDRAERRDLPTAHQLLIWRDRDSSVSQHNTSAESAISDFDNFLNWNTSSSFEHLAATSTPARARTPGVYRHSGLSDKTLDDMAFRRISAANKVPTTLANISELASQSYLSITSALSPSCTDTVEEANDPPDSDEPDIRIDDVLFRNIRDANKIKIIEPQPKFGIPLGPITAGANSDYLHAVPDDEKYRSTFNSMRNPDLVKDDLAFRHLRKDDNQQCDPSHLGIVKDPHGLIVSSTNWPPKKETVPAGGPFIYYPNKHNPIMRSLSENIAQIIRKQSSRPGGRLDDIITYEDLTNPVVYDSIKYTMDLITKEKIMADTSGSPDPPGGSREISHYNVAGTTVYEILRHHHSQPDLSTPDEGVCISPSSEAATETAACDETSQSCRDVGNNEGPVCDPVQSTESQAITGEEVIPTEIIINSCLIEQNNVDLTNLTSSVTREKEKQFPQPNFMASFVEKSKMIDLKTLSDGQNVSDTEIEDQYEKEEQEQEHEEGEGERDYLQVSDIIEEDDKPDPSSEREESETRIDVEFPKSERSGSSSQTPAEDIGVTDLLSEMTGVVPGVLPEEGGKMSSDEVISLLSHPGNLVIAIFLACLHSVTGLDLLNAFSLLLTIVSFVSLILQ